MTYLSNLSLQTKPHSTVINNAILSQDSVHFSNEQSAEKQPLLRLAKSQSTLDFKQLSHHCTDDCCHDSAGKEQPEPLDDLIAEVRRVGVKGIRLPRRLNKSKKNFAVNFSILETLRHTQKKAFISPDSLIFSEFTDATCKEFRSYDKATGEVFTFLVKGKKTIRKRSSAEIISDRFALQKTVAKLLPEFRISKCLHCVQSNARHISVYMSKKHKTVSVSNLQTCGSVWLCPVCAAKITERRRKEVNKAIEAHKAAGGSVSFVTRTTPHYKNDSLLSIRNKYRKADEKYRGHRAYKTTVKLKKVIGSIKVFELTVSDANGWHLHVHEVYFHDAGAFEGAAVSSNPAYVQFLKEFEAGLYERWRASALAAGFEEPSREHGLQVQNGDFAADYFAKWGVEPSTSWGADAELTKSHIKDSNKGYTPFALFRLYQETENEALVPIIQEYAHTMHGQKQLMWSRGLKARFAIDDLEDEELIEQLEDDAEEIGTICPMQWKFIVQNNLRTEFFILAAQGFEVLTEFLSSISDYPVDSSSQNLNQ